MRLYLDVCCLNRPFDDQTQERIHLETEAILIIFSNITSGKWELAGSDYIDFEISKIIDEERLTKVKFLASNASIHKHQTPEIIQRAKLIESKGFKILDALHIASAEACNSDYFLTTDDIIVSKYQKNITFFNKIKILNPIIFVSEVI